jgi:hypothetical protein
MGDRDMLRFGALLGKRSERRDGRWLAAGLLCAVLLLLVVLLAVAVLVTGHRGERTLTPRTALFIHPVEEVT